jgi:3-methyladenine DNA glycosylase/8-oxoguanine DNA glycosylase
MPHEVHQSRRLRLPDGIDPILTLSELWHGPADPHLRFEGQTVCRAGRTPDGPASVRLAVDGSEVRAEAWGPGAAWTLDALPDLLGARDDPSLLQPRHRLVAELVRRLPGLRMPRTGAVMDVLMPTVLGQKVTSLEANRAYRALVRRYGEPAPGPLHLSISPAPQTLARLPYYELHPLGIERRRADVLRLAARAATQLEAIVGLPPAEGRRRLESLPGVGPWTAAETTRLALGDPDAVSIGDYHLPTLVAFALAGERRGDDARMLELLEPYRGQRARVVRLLELSGLHPPRRGPRMAPRSIAAI